MREKIQRFFGLMIHTILSAEKKSKKEAIDFLISDGYLDKDGNFYINPNVSP